MLIEGAGDWLCKVSALHSGASAKHINVPFCTWVQLSMFRLSCSSFRVVYVHRLFSQAAAFLFLSLPPLLVSHSLPLLSSWKSTYTCSSSWICQLLASLYPCRPVFLCRLSRSAILPSLPLCLISVLYSVLLSASAILLASDLILYLVIPPSVLHLPCVVCVSLSLSLALSLSRESLWWLMNDFLAPRKRGSTDQKVAPPLWIHSTGSGLRAR